MPIKLGEDFMKNSRKYYFGIKVVNVSQLVFDLNWVKSMFIDHIKQINPVVGF